MSSTFITKRPHRKSRAGCKTCKARKIKCDEAHPSCTFCATRNIQCIYPPHNSRSDQVLIAFPKPATPAESSSSSTSDEDEDGSLSLTLISPMPPVIVSSGNLSKEDLRLMYHWSTFTCNTIGVGEHMNNVLRFVLPELAFENEFLLNGILAIASLHRQKLLPDPGDSKRQTDVYRLKALSTFRKAVAELGPDSPNYDAALAMAVMVVVLSSQDFNSDCELTIVRWIVLYRGLYHLMMMRPMTGLSQTSVSPIFTRKLSELKSDPVVPTVLLNMLSAIDITDPDYPEVPYYCSVLDALGMLYASLREDGIGTNLAVRVVTWCSYGSESFAKCSRERRPRALVILAYYLIFMKLVKGLWWIEGLADRDIKAIGAIVGPEYAVCMEVPLQIADMTDVEEIAKLALR